ncbi:hypothetical protein UY3_09538 [Chelonia mydas]|uniref:Uncharacterized protein n=1 Tax=Chelonia mydas TaxID=8469 RepID=M7BMT4_CHEMY|nr:hypothetical protein UY3_09538 [Chelonia mydas]
MPVETGPSQEEEILDKDVEWEWDPAAEDDLEVRDACSQELFSTHEEPSQSQQSDLGEAQTGEEVPDPSLINRGTCSDSRRSRSTYPSFAVLYCKLQPMAMRTDVNQNMFPY